jgi:hypothetical protein
LDQNIIDWKNYLKNHTQYSGDTYTDTIDDDFKDKMIQLESVLSKEIPGIEGLIWQRNTNCINPNISIQDYEEALKLLSDSKQNKIQSFAQATFDALGPPDNSCLLADFMITSDESKENDDPDDPNTLQNNDSTVPRKLQDFSNLLKKNQ